MKSFVETSNEARKKWTKPELKKIDIDQITAAKNGPTPDGFNAS